VSLEERRGYRRLLSSIGERGGRVAQSDQQRLDVLRLSWSSAYTMQTTIPLPQKSRKCGEKRGSRDLSSDSTRHARRRFTRRRRNSGGRVQSLVHKRADQVQGGKPVVTRLAEIDLEPVNIYGAESAN
jgi:hypothetical protein